MANEVAVGVDVNLESVYMLRSNGEMVPALFS